MASDRDPSFLVVGSGLFSEPYPDPVISDLQACFLYSRAPRSEDKNLSHINVNYISKLPMNQLTGKTCEKAEILLFMQLEKKNREI